MNDSSHGRNRRTGWILALIAVSGILFAVWKPSPPLSSGRSPGESTPNAGSDAPTDISKAAEQPTPTLPPAPGNSNPLQVAPSAGSSALKSIAEPPPARVDSARSPLLDALLELPMSADGRLTPDLVARWADARKALIQAGAGVVPAIRDYLATGTDLLFEGDAALRLGAGSMRLSLLDALGEIGGDDAVAALAATLGDVQRASELRQAALHLSRLAPGTHDAGILDAGRRLVAEAGGSQLGRTEIGPAFEALSRWGGTGAATELASWSGQWRYYSGIALAAMPDNAGVSALMDLAARGSTTERGFALEMLVQSAHASPAAREALLSAVAAGKVPESQWLQMGPVLTGETYQFMDAVRDAARGGASTDGLKSTHISHGNQNFFVGPPSGGWTSDQLRAQVKLLDELAAVVPSGAGRTAVDEARARINQRTPPPP